MQYLCLKQLTAANVAYFAGDIIPDGVILPERSAKLVSNGYISELDEAALQEGTAILPKDGIPADGKFYTREQAERMVADAVAEAIKKQEGQEEQIEALRGYAAGLEGIQPGVLGNTIPISVQMEGSGENSQMMPLPMEPQEIQQVFSIMQMNVDEGAKAIAEASSKNVLILLHAADSRITVKNAAKKQADKLFPADEATNVPGNGNGTTGTHAEGADT